MSAPIIIPGPGAKFDYARSRGRFSGFMINARWGVPAVLRRVGLADRPCRVVVTNYSPVERQGMMANPVDRKALVSAVDASGAPLDPEPTTQDRLITFKADPVTGATLDPPQEDESLSIVAPPAKVGNGSLTIFWRMQVRR